MKEDFLHFLWRFQYFQPGSHTTTGEALTVSYPGHPNVNAGPDFLEAKLQLAGVTWAGHVELHVRSSDWRRHGHQTDPAYGNVVLHVVWEDDQPLTDENGTPVPTLQLKGQVDQELEQRYGAIMGSLGKLACEASLPHVSDIVKLAMKEKALLERLQQKAQLILTDLNQLENDWEAVAYKYLLMSFGFKLNKEAFAQLSQKLPFRVVRKQGGELFKIEALLFGQAGFLQAAELGTYGQQLKDEHSFLAQKHQLPAPMVRSQWKFSRTRPGNFPTVRLSQVAAVLSKNVHLLDPLLHHDHPSQVVQAYTIHPSPYWRLHHDFGKPSARPHTVPGPASMENVLINLAAPLLVAYGVWVDQEGYKEKALNLLSGLKPEANSIVKTWKTAGVPVDSAFDSQGLIQQFNLYCKPRRCLQCPVGIHLMKKPVSS